MALAPNPPICLTDLRTEFGDANGGNVCLTEYYAGGANVAAGTSGTNGAVPSSGTVCLTDFLGTSNVIPVVSNTQNYTGNVAASFADNLSYTGSQGMIIVDYQYVMRTSISGSNYVATLYVEETSNGNGVYNSAGMSTGTLYPVQTVTFTQGNWPDGYALDHSVTYSSSSGGAYQENTSLLAGTGETYSSGSNWDNTTFTLLNPTTNTAFKVRQQVTGECWTGVAEFIDTISLKFNKSGYPNLTAATFNVQTEMTFGFSGPCF